jgi:hypothetical protein
MPRPVDAAPARTDEQRSLVAEDLVDGPGCEEGAEDLRPALDEEMADAFGMQSIEGLADVVGGQPESVRVEREEGLGRQRRGAEHDRPRLVRQRGAVSGAGVEPGVIGQCGAGADEDGVDAGADLMRMGPRVRRGDPLTGAVRGGDGAVEALRDLGRDEGAGGGHGLHPPAIEFVGAVAVQSRTHPQPRLGEDPTAAGGRVGSGRGRRRRSMGSTPR